MLYSCTAGGNNQDQMALVKESCPKPDECQVEASREFLGNSECPGTGDANMSLWLVYSCDGGTDATKIEKPKCDESLVTTTTTTTTTTTQVILSHLYSAQVVFGCLFWSFYSDSIGGVGHREVGGGCVHRVALPRFN